MYGCAGVTMRIRTLIYESGEAMIEKLSGQIDAVSEKCGQACALLIFPMVGVVVYEVIMRYVFTAPTSWGFESTTFIYGIHYILGLSYTQLHDSHVAIDIFSSKLPSRKKAVLSIITSGMLFFPTFGCMTYFSWVYALSSWKEWERLSTSWAPPVYPFKTLMAVGFTLLLIQGFSALLKDIMILKQIKEKS